MSQTEVLHLGVLLGWIVTMSEVAADFSIWVLPLQLDGLLGSVSSFSLCHRLKVKAFSTETVAAS